MIALGAILCGLVLPGPFKMGSVVFDVYTLIIGTSAVIVGTQVLICFLLAKQYASAAGLIPPGRGFSAFRRVTSLESALVFGGILTLIGVVGVVAAVVDWQGMASALSTTPRVMRLIVPAVTSSPSASRSSWARFSRASSI
jgi:hypothetical protein